VQHLDLSDNPVTDAAVQTLSKSKRLSALQSLDLSGTRVEDPKTRQRLQKAWPGIDVTLPAALREY